MVRRDLVAIFMTRVLSVIGLLGGLFWVSLAFFPPMCSPVTEESELLCNRLWSPALLGMWLGSIGFFSSMRPWATRTVKSSSLAWSIGFVMMFLGNFVEYWILYDLPHQGTDGFFRALTWMTVLVGLLISQIASMIIGLTGFKSRYISPWLSGLYVLLLPTTLAIGFMDMHWVGIPIGILSMSTGLAGFGLGQKSIRTVV